MADKKDTGFTVTDRRLFTSEGELRQEVSEENKQDRATPQQTPPEKPAQPAAAGQEDMPPAPTVAEQQAQKDAYQKSSKDLDARVELGGHSAKDLEMTFERFIASLYMTAMLQLGLMQEEGGQPRIDLIGDKTKGNLTSREENFLHNSLYELRMAYVEVTNSLARPPQAAQGTPKAR